MLTKEDMYKAQLTFLGILNEHYEKLPISREESNSFCVFCFNFHSSPDHECYSLAISNEAEKTAGGWLCQLVGNAKEVDRELLEKLKESVFSQIEEYEKYNNYTMAVSNSNQAGTVSQEIGKRSRPMETDHSRKKRKVGDTTFTVESSSMTKRRVRTQTESSSSSSDNYSFGEETEESQGRADSPVFKFSSTGRIIRKTTRYEAVDKSPIETQKKLSDANILADFEITYVHVPPPLPVDRQNWTREHYIMHYHEKAKTAIQHLNNRQNYPIEAVNEKANQRN